MKIYRVNPPAAVALTLACSLWVGNPLKTPAAPFDAAPYALSLTTTNQAGAAHDGVVWEDPREVHRVVVRFASPPANPETLRLEYWGSRWPEQRLPKDREPGGGDVGWMELGNWHKGDWRTADTETSIDGATVVFSFRPVNAVEFPKLKDYPARFRYTLKLRLSHAESLPRIEEFSAYTDSSLELLPAVRIEWKNRPGRNVQCEVFNGRLQGCTKTSSRSHKLAILGTVNRDPNTFDRTLVTVRCPQRTFTFGVDDLQHGPLFLPDLGVAVLCDTDSRDYEALARDVAAGNQKTLYDRVAEMPEQTWQAAWNGMPAKKSHIYLPLGLDGGRQRFLLDADGTVRFRYNDGYLNARPGQDTPGLDLEPGPARFRFGPARTPVTRTIQEASIPICDTTWETNGVRITQSAFVTLLEGNLPDNAPPPADALTVCLVRFVFTNLTAQPQAASLPLSYRSGDSGKLLQLADSGFLRLGKYLRAQVETTQKPGVQSDVLLWSWVLQPGETAVFTIKIPYLLLTAPEQERALARLDFKQQRQQVASFWQRRLEVSARLITPEPMLNEFYRAHAGHLLINCEREPESTRRFARVGSFSYGAYGNESCMMVVDLDRRGYHREAQECLDAWLHYQSTVGLPGDFASKRGVLYGAGGYEAGGYNQHHGWILWMLAEHYRFTRDQSWLNSAAPGIVAAADWIINETARTANRHELERGLLPAGSLEDIGDWWTWLSTSCYTWRGLDSAAWALEQIRHPEAKRIRAAADQYHQHLLANFRKASERSPVVRLRDGTAVPKIPSQVHRRGRSFGWICETLEGSLHLLITRALDAKSPEASWILKDYEDNLFLSNQYGYTLDDFDRYWFGRGGMSMQACLLLDAEPYLYRDDVKNALRAIFNAIAVSYFPDERMNTEHALPNMGDWRGDHYKSSDEANACGWLRQLFIREEGNQLLIGQAVPREWLAAGKECGIERAGTYFGPVNIHYTATDRQITARLDGPTRNPPNEILVRFRLPEGRPVQKVLVNGKPWKSLRRDWVVLPGSIGRAEIIAFTP